MRTYYECLPCLLRQTVEAMGLVDLDPEDREKIIREVLVKMSEMELDKTPPHLAHFIHGLIKELSDVGDPYKEIKQEFNTLALTMAPEMRRGIIHGADPFANAIKIAIAGNIIDFGPKSDLTHQEVRDTVQDCLGQPLEPNKAPELEEAIRESDKILYLGDNAGEIVFDQLLLEQMPLKKITYAVKGAPIINDATMDDAVETGLTKMVKVIHNGSDAPGTILEICSQEFLAEYRDADLIIAKGQANYETLSQVRDKKIFFLLKVKCPVIAQDIGCPLASLVLKTNI